MTSCWWNSDWSFEVCALANLVPFYLCNLSFLLQMAFFFFLTWGIITWRSFKSTTLNLSVSYVWLVLHGAIFLSLLFLQTLSLWPGHLSSTGIPSTGATASPLWPIDGLVCPVGPGCPAAAFAWFLLIYWSLAHTWCQGKYLVIESGNHGVCISCIAVVLIMC